MRKKVSFFFRISNRSNLASLKIHNSDFNLGIQSWKMTSDGVIVPTIRELLSAPLQLSENILKEKVRTCIVGSSSDFIISENSNVDYFIETR